MKNRYKEPEKNWFRSDRFFTVNEQWYFNTRERLNIGPFATLNDAKRGFNLFLDALRNESTLEHAASVACGGNWAVTYYQ